MKVNKALKKEQKTHLSYVGKDKVTHWSKHKAEKRTVKTRRENITRRLPSSSSATTNLKNPIDIWNYFMSEEIIDIIVDCTNKYIEELRVSGKYSRERDANPTSKHEIRALIGLLYLGGVTDSNRTNRDDVWKRDGYGIELFHFVMSQQRFKFLLRCIRFDDKTTRSERQKYDKLAAIRNIFDIFVSGCQKGYHFSDFVTIDEMLVGFRGKCNFRQYIPSKPNKYGLKILAICDAKMFYIGTMEVYVGQQPDGPYKKSNKPSDVVLSLSENISRSGRNLTMDTWFTSVQLVMTLLKEHNITVLGTIRKNEETSSRVFKARIQASRNKYVCIQGRVHFGILYSKKKAKMFF